MNEYEAQVRKFYSEIWDKMNFNEIPNVLHSDFVFRGSLGVEKIGHEGFKEYVEYVHAGLTEYTCVVEDIVVQHEAAFAKMMFTGTHHAEFMGHPPTGREISWAGAALFKFSDHKISNLWVLGDLKGLEQQLDHKT